MELSVYIGNGDAFLTQPGKKAQGRLMAPWGVRECRNEESRLDAGFRVYFPEKSGDRFSRKAVVPSFLSAEAKIAEN